LFWGDRRSWGEDKKIVKLFVGVTKTVEKKKRNLFLKAKILNPSNKNFLIQMK